MNARLLEIFSSDAGDCPRCTGREGVTVPMVLAAGRFSARNPQPDSGS